MNHSNPTFRQRILQVLSYPVSGSVIITVLLIILGFIPWFWINRYVDRFFQIETRNSYYSEVADRSVNFEERTLRTFHIGDVLLNGIAAGRYSESENPEEAFEQDILSARAGNQADIKIRWVNSIGETDDYPADQSFPVFSGSAVPSSGIQLRQEENGRWWFLKESKLTGQDDTTSLSLAFPVDTVWTKVPLDENIRFYSALFTQDGTRVTGDPIILADDTLIDTIYLDGLRLYYAVEPETGWAGITRGRNTLFWLLGLFLVSGIVVIVNLTLKRQERLHQKIAQRTKDLEQEFRQRLSVEDDLDKSQAALLDASRRAHIGIWECDVMTDEFYWSDELFHIIDETPYTFTPTIESFLAIIHPEDLPIYLQFRRIAIHEKKSGEFEIRIIKPKGGIVYCWITINPKLNPAGELSTLWGIAQDITVIKEAERQLKDTNRILQMVNLCDQIIVRETDENVLLEKVCQTMAELGEYRCILVAEQTTSGDQDLITLYSHSTDPVIVDDPDIVLNKYTQPLIQKAIYDKAESIWFREEQKTATGRKAPLRNLPYSFMAALPVQLSETKSGVLAIFDTRPPFISAEELSHLHQLADDLSIGIQSIRRKESYARVLDALRVSENKFAKAFHTSPDSIAITRLSDGTYIDVNEGFVSNSGYTRDEIIGKKLDDINVWANLADRDHIVQELRKNGVVSNYEAEFVAKDGHTATGLFSARLIEIEGEVDLLSITRDISDRNDAAKALRESEERFRLITESMVETIWLMDLNFRTTYVSPSVERTRGFTFEEISKMSMSEQLTPESRPFYFSINDKLK